MIDSFSWLSISLVCPTSPVCSARPAVSSAEDALIASTRKTKLSDSFSTRRPVGSLYAIWKGVPAYVCSFHSGQKRSENASLSKTNVLVQKTNGKQKEKDTSAIICPLINSIQKSFKKSVFFRRSVPESRGLCGSMCQRRGLWNWKFTNHNSLPDIVIDARAPLLINMIWLLLNVP